MKKILSLFAIVAAFVLSAVSFVSCTSNDDSPVTNTYKFNLVFTTQSQDPDVLSAIDIANKAFANAYAESITGTDNNANLAWYKFTSESDFQAMVNELAKTSHDKTLVLTVSMLKNGSEYKKQVYTPLILDF